MEDFVINDPLFREAVVAIDQGKFEDLQELLAKHPELASTRLDDPAEGFHSHATALHQAVWSSSLEAVKVLVEAGGRQDLKDKIYEGTPLEWAMYSLTSDEFEDPTAKERNSAIAEYLQQQLGS